MRAPIVLGPAAALEYRNILVPLAPGRETEEALDVACRLAAERGARVVAIAVVEVPLELPLDAEMPEAEDEANDLLDAARALGELLRRRRRSARLARARQRRPRDRRRGRAAEQRRSSSSARRGAGRARAPVFGETATTS